MGNTSASPPPAPGIVDPSTSSDDQPIEQSTGTNPPPAKHSSPRIPVLDGLRAIAIILVLMSHAGLSKIVPGGLGVTIFFFLSGYLITTLMRTEVQRTNGIDIKKFYLRRALRIFPPLYITLVLFLLCVFLGVYPNEMKLGPVLLQFVHLTNYTTALGWDEGNGIPKMPLWSLAVEEHFYLVFPFLYLFIARRLGGRQQAIILLGMCVAVLAVRIFFASILTKLDPIYSWTHTRIDSILFGCILAVWSNPVMDNDRDSYVPGAAHFMLALGAMLMCLLIRENIGSHELFGPRAEFFRQTIRYSIQGMALLVIFSYLIRQTTGPLHALLISKPMKFIGLLSYTVYLADFFIFEGLHNELPGTRYPVVIAVGLVVTFGYAWLMYILVEKPLTRMRSRMH